MKLFVTDDEVFYINGSDTLPPPLGKQEEAEVIERIKNGDESGKETLIVHNLRLVVYIAKRFETAGAGIEDLISIGTIGLIKAVNTFKPDKNIKLATYASRCIENEILMFLRKSSQLKNEVSIDEPLNTDWDGNELLLCDVLGSDPDIINRGIEAALRAQRQKGAHPEAGRGLPRDIAVVHIKARKEDNKTAQKGAREAGGLKSEKWKVESVKWKVESGKWKVESGKLNDVKKGRL